jgi:hypothetical protein
MKHRGIRFQGDGSANQIHGHRIPASLMCYDSQKVQSIGMARFHCQNLPVNGLGFRKPPSLVMLERQGKGLGDRKSGHAG